MKIKGRIKYGLFFSVCLCLGAVFNGTYAQTFSPLTVTGFNNDVIAETGTDATVVTTTVIDATEHIMYSANFAATNGLSGGIVDNGTIVNGAYTWQLAPFAGNNALYLSNAAAIANTAASGTLTLATPGSFSNISLLLFSTEGNNIIDVVMNFTDGTTVDAGDFNIYDWFDNPGQVYSSFGRIVLGTAPPYAMDGVFDGNPHFYKADVFVPCNDQTKQLQSVTISFVSGTKSGRVVVLGVSGAAYAPPVVAPVITDATCNNSNGSVALNLTGPSFMYFYSWNSTPVQYTPTATGLAAGTYTCSVTDFNNCKTTYQETVGAVPLAVVTATASPNAVCSGTPSTLSASATGPAVTGYAWTPGTQTGSPVTVSPTATTTYTVTGQDANGCTVSATATITVIPPPVASFTVSADSICQGSTETVTFTGTASSAASYNWNGFAGGTLQNGSDPGPYTVQYTTPGNYTLQLQVTDGGCPSAVVSQNIVVSESPSPAFSIATLPICSGGTVTISFTGTAPPGANPIWNWGGGKVQSGNGFGPYTVKYNNGGMVKLTVKNGVCTVSTPVQTVAVIDNPLAAFTQQTAGCLPMNVTFTNQSTNADAYTWDFGDGSTATAANPVHTYSTAGTYTVSLATSAQGQCFDTLVKANIITVTTPPVVAFTAVPDTGVSVELHLANFVFTNQSQNATGYSWSFGDGGTSNLEDPSHQYNAPGDYTVTLYAMNGPTCVDSVSHQYYKVIPDKDLKIPNAFSPNGDGINDRWEIDGLKPYPDCTVTVFNRWGQEVFRSQGYQNPWDGSFKGQLVPLATYYYVITVPGRKPYSGWVIVLK